MQDKKKRYIYIDVLNIFACLCVIFMHCNGIAHIYSDTRAWKESMAVETLAYWAVPVFFMISGATLLGYRDKYTTGVFFKKRILKTVIPFFIWILINLALKVATGKMEMEGGVRGIVNMFTNTTTEHVYWFFIPLFMVYLSLPVVSVLKDYKKLLVYMTAMAFLIYSVYPVTCTLLKIPINGYIQFPAAGGISALCTARVSHFHDRNVPKDEAFVLRPWDCRRSHPIWNDTRVVWPKRKSQSDILGIYEFSICILSGGSLCSGKIYAVG